MFNHFEMLFAFAFLMTARSTIRGCCLCGAEIHQSRECSNFSNLRLRPLVKSYLKCQAA